MSDEINVNLIGNYTIELDEQGPPGAPGLGIESVTNVDYDPQTGVYTYRITYTDGTYYDFEIQGGGIYTFSTGLSVEDNTVSVNFSEVATAEQGSKADSAIQSVTTGSTNGTISVDGFDVSVYGLGSSAYTSSSDYATSSQGAKADTAVQPSDLQSALANKLDVDPDGVNNLIENNKINIVYVPDILLGQMLYAGTFVPNTAVATLTTNAKTKLGTSDNTITLTNDTTSITGYTDNEGNFYLASANGTFASMDFLAGDWLVSTGSGWTKIDNTDAVTGVKGNAESTYRIGNVNITADNVLPTQTSNNGKYLKTNGTTCSWEDVVALPSQTGNNNKYLKTDGTNASWVSLPAMVGADGVNAGSSGLVPAPTASQNTSLLCGDGAYKLISTGLYLDNGSLKVDTDSVPTQNSTKPITSGAVYDTLGDIETLLQGV